jgi:hypothetical protein
MTWVGLEIRYLDEGAMTPCAFQDGRRQREMTRCMVSSSPKALAYLLNVIT